MPEVHKGSLSWAQLVDWQRVEGGGRKKGGQSTRLTRSHARIHPALSVPHGLRNSSPVPGCGANSCVLQFAVSQCLTTSSGVLDFHGASFFHEGCSQVSFCSLTNGVFENLFYWLHHIWWLYFCFVLFSCGQTTQDRSLCSSGGIQVF